MRYHINKKWGESTSLLPSQNQQNIHWVIPPLILVGGVVWLLNQTWGIIILVSILFVLCVIIWKQNHTIQHHQAIYQQTQFLQQAFDSIPNYIFVKNDKGEYVLANRAFAKRHNLTTQTIIGKTDRDLYGTLESKEYEDDDLLVMQTKQTRLTPELQVTNRETGEPMWVQIVKVPLMLDQPNADHVLAIITDITDRKQKLDTLQQMTQNHAKFVAYASHDIKSPLTALQMSVDYLLEIENKALSAKQIHVLQAMTSSIEQISNLVKDLSMLIQVESAEFMLNKTAVSISQVITPILHSMETSFAKRQHTVTNLIPYDLPNVYGDHRRLGQIFINILSNAYKYTPDEGQISLTAKAIPNQMVCISITDNGLGIKEEEQGKLFEHFFRSADPKANQISGAGLGLSVTKKLVDAHDGHIWFESTYGKGTTFHIELPIAIEELEG